MKSVVHTFVISPWICVTPGIGAMACKSTATILAFSSWFSDLEENYTSKKVIDKGLNLLMDLYQNNRLDISFHGLIIY